MTPNTPSGEPLTGSELATSEAAGRAAADTVVPSDVSTSVSPPPWCHTWEIILTLPSTPDCEISSVPWYDVGQAGVRRAGEQAHAHDLLARPSPG